MYKILSRSLRTAFDNRHQPQQIRTTTRVPFSEAKIDLAESAILGMVAGTYVCQGDRGFEVGVLIGAIQLSEMFEFLPR